MDAPEKNARDNFEKWFRARGVRKNWFAETIGVHNSSLSRWLSGDVTPHLAVRKRIEEMTDGAVKADAW